MKPLAYLLAAALTVTAFASAANAATTSEPLLGTGAPEDALTEYQTALLLGTRASLPMKLDDFTTLYQVSFDGLVFVYDYNLTLAYSPDMDINAFKAAQLSGLCTALGQLARPNELESLRYRYETTDGKFLTFDITKADCAAV